MNLTRTHKLTDHYGSVCELYEELYKDIKLDMVCGNRTPMSDKCWNCFDYVEYTRSIGNLDVHAYKLSVVYVQLGLTYWHDSDDAQQALFSFLQTNIHARLEGNHHMALKLYSQAIGHFSHQENLLATKTLLICLEIREKNYKPHRLRQLRKKCKT